MREVRTTIKAVNLVDTALYKNNVIEKEKIREIELDALVDTGAVMLLLPQDAVEALGLEVKDRIIVSLANEEKIELDVAGDMSLEVCNRKTVKDCLVGPPRCEPLVGHLLFERLDLIPDPVKQRLAPRPESPFLPSLKLK